MYYRNIAYRLHIYYHGDIILHDITNTYLLCTNLIGGSVIFTCFGMPVFLQLRALFVTHYGQSLIKTLRLIRKSQKQFFTDFLHKNCSEFFEKNILVKDP